MRGEGTKVLIAVIGGGPRTYLNVHNFRLPDTFNLITDARSLPFTGSCKI